MACDDSRLSHGGRIRVVDRVLPLNVSVILTIFSACSDVKWERASGMQERVLVAMAGVTSSSSVMVGNLQRAINGMSPGMLFRVTLLCTNGVALMLSFAVGLRDVMIPGASVMRGMVMMEESSIPFVV